MVINADCRMTKSQPNTWSLSQSLNAASRRPHIFEHPPPPVPTKFERHQITIKHYITAIGQITYKFYL